MQLYIKQQWQLLYPRSDGLYRHLFSWEKFEWQARWVKTYCYSMHIIRTVVKSRRGTSSRRTVVVHIMSVSSDCAFFSPGERGAELCRLRHQQPLLHLGLIFPQSLCFSLTCPSFFSSQFASDSFLSVVKLLVSTSIRHSHFFVLVNSHDNNLLDKRAVKFVNGLMLKVWMCF